MRINTKQVIEWCGATTIVAPIDATKLATSITWDSREVVSDSIYIAFPGKNVDGHDFIEEALLRGACIVIVMDTLPQKTLLLAKEMGSAILEVANTRSAFSDLAKEWKKLLSAITIAVTGSVGKTTTKNLIRDVLSTKFKTVATKANQNNELGVPNTILQANPETQCIVVEMGMRGRGQIKELCSFVKPDISVITNVGESHIELLGSQTNIARAKGEIVTYLPEGRGYALFNACDEWTPFIINETNLKNRLIKIVFFQGYDKEVIDKDNQPIAWAEDVSLDSQGKPNFVLCLKNKRKAQCHLSLQGLHNVSNACAAAAVGDIVSVPFENIISGLENSVPEIGRQEILHGRNHITIINDTYNANPDSMRASLLVLSNMQVTHWRYAVLGDMGELGDYAIACHQGIGRLIASLPIDRLICIGNLAKQIAIAAKEQGYPKEKVFATTNRGEALNYLEMNLEPGDVVLVKASHAMELEHIVRGLIN